MLLTMFDNLPHHVKQVVGGSNKVIGGANKFKL